MKIFGILFAGLFVSITFVASDAASEQRLGGQLELYVHPSIETDNDFQLESNALSDRLNAPLNCIPAVSRRAVYELMDSQNADRIVAYLDRIAEADGRIDTVSRDARANRASASASHTSPTREYLRSRKPLSDVFSDIFEIDKDFDVMVFSDPPGALLYVEGYDRSVCTNTRLLLRRSDIDHVRMALGDKICESSQMDLYQYPNTSIVELTCRF